MEQDILSILRCPVSGADLVRHSDHRIGTRDGRHLYEVRDGIYHLLPGGQSGGADPEAAELREEKKVVQTFYDSYGWKTTDGGGYCDTSLFVDTRSVSYDLTRRCMRRVKDYLPERGRFLLDAGSGPIPHEEYLEYHRGFEKRICLDFSIVALREAQGKLGDRGIYVLGDMTRLPFNDGVMDAVVSSHVIYHIPADDQQKAFLELWRVLAPGGRAAIVYAWSHAPLATGVERVMNLLMPVRKTAQGKAPASPKLYYHAHSWKWFKSQAWPFSYRIAPYRIIGSRTMRRHFAEDFRSRIAAKGILALQAALPGLAGKFGRYPIIALEKR